jgi:tRNA U34 2-thiouridine synthase MnmA/TrmU
MSFFIRTMNSPARKVRALGLCSGGLDSILSALVLKRQGIDIEWIAFETPFFSSSRASRAAKSLGIPLTVARITRIYIGMLKNPPCGYGRYMNPCMDCHALMFRLAGGRMKKDGFDFLFSGEVLGQRPMSQTRSSLRYVEKHSGYDGYILRPLSAKRLSPTIPEKEGLVDRDRLLAIAGRSRKQQIQLSEEFGITDYPAPAGGCLLTDKKFSIRLRDLFDHQTVYSDEDLYLLKCGRHIRLNPEVKIIVGRTQSDNNQILQHYRPSADVMLRLKGYAGPTVLIPRGCDRESMRVAAAICAGYGKVPADMDIEVVAVSAENQSSFLVRPVAPARIQDLLIS